MPRKVTTILVSLLVISAGAFASEIHDATREGDLPTIMRLLDSEPELINQPESRFAAMPLHIAVYFNQVDAAQVLVERGADLEAPGLQGWTPLVLAAIRGRIEMAELLLEAGAQPATPSANGEIPLSVAASRGEMGVLRKLLDAGAGVNIRDGRGSTALHAAAFAGSVELTDLLIAHGASVEVENLSGNTPLELALKRDHFQVAARLCDAAARNRNAPVGESESRKITVAEPGLIEPRITILYDNYVSTEGTRSDWGFACLIEGGEKTILFDTGTKAEILLANAAALQVDLSQVEVVIISHEHGDHVGGLAEILRLAPEASVYLPPSISYEIFARFENFATQIFFHRNPTRIMPGVVLSGELGKEIREQSLLLNTAEGVVVVAGCSHPGIDRIATRSRNVIDRPIALVFGGFHMGHLDEAQTLTTIQRLEELEVQAATPTHCTGEQAIALFKDDFAGKYVPGGVGRRIEVVSDGESNERGIVVEP